MIVNFIFLKKDGFRSNSQKKENLENNKFMKLQIIAELQKEIV